MHGRADTNMWQMNEQLKREEDDLCGKRGLEPNSELQTFEIEVPLRFREQYEDVVRPLLQEGLPQQRRNIPNSMGTITHDTQLGKVKVDSHLPQVVPRVDSAFYRIIRLVLLVFIPWIVIYPVDSAIHLLKNRRHLYK